MKRTALLAVSFLIVAGAAYAQQPGAAAQPGQQRQRRKPDPRDMGGGQCAQNPHNCVLHANCEAIARKMGNALCAPIVKFVPEGDISPKTSHMVSPGTISMRE